MPDNKEQRAQQASKHTALMKQVFAAEIQASIDGAVIHEYGDGRELAIAEGTHEETKTRVTTHFICDELFRSQAHAVIIDTGAFTKPAGNYAAGALSPEARLCDESNLYPILCGMKKEYYDKNRGWESGQMYTDRAMYLPDVAFYRDGTTRKADVVVMSTPNRARALENGRSPESCDQMLGFCVETMLRVAASKGAEVLICGAFCCGRNGFEADVVTELIKTWLDAHPGVFSEVVFSVGRAFYDQFDAAFGHEEAPVKQASADDDAEEEDEEDWRNMELPEGVTLG